MPCILKCFNGHSSRGLVTGQAPAIKPIVLCSRPTDVVGISTGTNVASDARTSARISDMASIGTSFVTNAEKSAKISDMASIETSVVTNAGIRGKITY